MKCDKCGKPSVYHSTMIINGVSETKNLCRDCAIKEGVFVNEPSSIFDDMFSLFSDVLPFKEIENKVCPVCKTSLREFKSTGKLGCINCYDVFSKEIGDIVKRIAPKEKHKEETIKTPKKRLSKQEKIDALRLEMKQAVAEERYEDAGKIKKQIEKLEAQDE